MKINPALFIQMLQRVIGIYQSLLNAFHSTKLTMSSESKWKYVIYFLFFTMSIILALTSCNPSYRVIHRGFGVYSDTIRVYYNSGNLNEFYSVSDFKR